MSLKSTPCFFIQSYGSTSSVSIWKVPSVLPFSFSGLSSPGCATRMQPWMPPPAMIFTGAPASYSATKLV